MSKRIISGIVLTLLLIGMLSLAFNIRQVRAATDTTLSVEPQSIIDSSLTPDNTFTINCSVVDVVDLFTWQIKLLFDPAILNCTEAWYPSDHVFAGKTMVPVAPIIDNDAGYILYGCFTDGCSSRLRG